MNKLLLLLLGVCLTQATIRSEDLADKVFGQGRAYSYRYEGEIMSGIPKTSDRFSGMRIECDARLQFQTDEEVLLRLENVKLKTLRGELESPEEKSLNRIVKKTSKETAQEQWHQDAFRQDLFTSSAEEWDAKSIQTSSQESRETPSMERHQQQKQREASRIKEQKTSAEQQDRRSSQRSSESVSREESEEVPADELAELRRQLEKPVLVVYRQGRVESIRGQKDEPQWSINIKRGVINLFQCTRNPKNSEMLDKDGREETNVAFDKSPERLFRIMEEDVSGQCETQYLIQDSRKEKGVQVVTKTKDFQNCRERPQQQRSFISGKKVSKTEKEEHLQSTVETRQRLVTDRSSSGKFLIQRAESRGQHVFQPYSQQGGDVITFAKQTLELIEAKTTIPDPKIPEPLQPEEKGKLMFVFEKKTPQPGSSQESRESTEQSKEVTQKKVTQLCEGIARGVRETITEDTPKQIIQLITELRKMDKQQLKTFCLEKIPKTAPTPKTSQEKAESETRKLMIDAVSMAGTEEALKAVKELLEESKITQEDAQTLIAGLSVSINPCTATATRIMLEIAKSPQAQQNPNLRKVCWLAFGTMVHKFTKTQPQEAAEVIQIKREYAKQLLAGIKPEKTAEEKMMCLKAIGNAGLEDSVDSLVEIISGKDAKTTPTEIRLQAIYALRRIAKKQPHKTRNILFPVFNNPENPAEERIAAFIGLMDSEPQASVLELVAQSTQRETSNQVGRFVYTHLRSCASSRMPRDQKTRLGCERALRLCRPFNLGIQYSQSEKFQAMDDEMKMGASVALQTIADKRSVLPRAATAKLNVQAMGYSINLLETGVRASGMQTMVDSLYRQWEDGKGVMHYLKKKSQETSREYRDSASAQSTERQRTLRNIEAEKIQSKLNIKTRTPEDPKGQIYLKIAGNEVYFHQFRSDLLKKFVREDRLSIQDIEQQLKEGVQTTMTKAHLVADATQRIPTSLGLPLELDIKAILLARSEIEGRMEVSPSLFREDRNNDKKEITAIDARLQSTHTIAMQTTGKMTVDCRVIKSGVALDVTMNSLIPISGKATFDIKNRQHKLTFETPEKERELLVLKSRPIVFTEETAAPKTPKTPGSRQVKQPQIKEITLQGKKIQRFPSQMKAAYGQQALGLEFSLKSSMVSLLNKEKRAPFQPLCGPVELRLAVKPGQNKPEKIEIECRPKETRYTSSEETSSQMSSKEQTTSQRVELDIRANHPRQERFMKIKLNYRDEQVEVDPRRRELDSRERKVPRKFLVRSLREKEPEMSSETQYQVRQDGKQQTRKTIAIQIERSRIPEIESWDTKMCVDMQLEYPTNRDVRLIQDGVTQALVDAKWGADCSGRGPRVQLNAKFQKSVEQRRQERREEAAEWESRSGEVLTQSQEQKLDSILDSVKSLWSWSKSKSEERSPRSTEESREQERSSQEKSQERASKETGEASRSWETSWQSSDKFQQIKLRRNLYKQCLKDRRDGQQYSPACSESLDQRSLLRELNAEIIFQNIPEWLQQASLAAHRYIQNTFYGRSSIRQVGINNPAGQIRVRASLDQPQREMNITIRTPRQEHNISRVPLDWVPLFFPSTRRTLTEQAMDKVTKNKYTPYCKVQANDKIRTFDDVEYKYRIGKCDHILAKDASPEERFMVLTNKPNQHRPEKTVKVFLETVKVEFRVPPSTSSQERQHSRETSQERQRSQEHQENQERQEENQEWQDQEWRQSQERRQSREHQLSREQSRQQPGSRRESQEQRTSQQTSAESQSQSQSRTSKSVEWTSSEEKLHQHVPIEVTIDGREAQIQPGQTKQIRHATSGKVICTIRRHGNTVELSSPKHGLKVKMDGHYVQVKVSHDYRKKLVGLCGNFDGEQSNEYEGPREEVYRSPKEFALSYQVPSRQCEGEGKKQPVMRNIMHTRLNERNEEEACFSKTPVAQCPPGSKKTKSEVRSTEFHCLLKELQSTQKMIKLYETKPLGDKLQGKSTDLVQDVEAELECRQD
ncbi:uncharacterized protein LOC144902798 [Branchiostoma floridae x Branchiostoma belcheri]